MSKVLNSVIVLVIVWAIFHAIWNIGNLEGFSGDLQGAQLYEGVFALTVGIGLSAILLQLRRKSQ
jgi:hypothetical protein